MFILSACVFARCKTHSQLLIGSLLAIAAALITALQADQLGVNEKLWNTTRLNDLPSGTATATISFNTSTTGASLAAQSVLGLYNADRDKPTNLQALLRESRWSTTIESITARLAVGVRTFGTKHL
jgi:hypothetical protein